VSHPVGFVPLSRFFLGPSLVLPGLVPGLAAGCQGWLVRAETDCHGIEDNAVLVLYKRWRRFNRSAADAIQKYIGFLKSFLESLRPIAGQLELPESPTILVELGISVLSYSILVGETFGYCISSRRYYQDFRRRDTIAIDSCRSRAIKVWDDRTGIMPNKSLVVPGELPLRPGMRWQGQRDDRSIG
jgi:hypothetical protein